MSCCVDMPGGGIIFPLPASCIHQEIRNYIWDKLRTLKTLYSTYCTLKWTKSRDDRLFFCFLLCSKARITVQYTAAIAPAVTGAVFLQGFRLFFSNSAAEKDLQQSWINLIV